MAKFKFQGNEYEIPEIFSNREMMEIEKISGVPAAQLDTGHYSVLVAIAKVTLERHGAHKAARALLEADMGSIEYEDDEDKEDDAGPPVVPEESPSTLTAVPGEGSGHRTSGTSSG